MTSSTPAVVNYFLKPGYIFLAKEPSIVSAVLGSCVSVCIYDQKRQIGGMNRFQLPCIYKKNEATAMYGNVATLALIRMMLSDGSKVKNLEAQVIGGAYNREFSMHNIGQENIITARKVLVRERICIASEDTGGEKGRKVIFNTHTSELAVFKVENLRKSDWYPYEEDR